VVQCPECKRFLCRSCGHRFSDGKVKVDVVKQGRVLSDSVHDFGDLDLVDGAVGDVGFQDSAFTVGKDVGSHSFPIVGKNIYSFLPNSREHRVCASETKAAKNLVEVESQIEKRAAGATELSQAEIKGKLVEYLWFLKKRGYTKSTVKTKVQTLKRLVRMGVNLLNPESVKDVLATHDEWSNNYKKIVIYAYDNFTEMLKISWKPPICKPLGKLPFVPLEKEVDTLIAGCSKKVATSLQLMKETGMRIGEVWSLEWTDIDDKRHTIRCQSEKYGNPRMFKVSGKLLAMLNALPKRSEKVFATGLKTHRASFNLQRKRLAQKLHNPRLLKISFHTLRHWKATMEYHHTKDILHVKQLLGHRSINSTMIYTHLINFEGDEFTCKTAKTIYEAKGLIEAGFDYVTDMNSYKLFRKRK